MVGDQQDLVLATLLQLSTDVGTLTGQVRDLHKPADCPGIKAVQRDVDVLAKALQEQATFVTGLRLTRAKMVGAILGFGLVAGGSGGLVQRILF